MTPDSSAALYFAGLGEQQEIPEDSRVHLRIRSTIFVKLCGQRVVGILGPA
jgi:hypothetical protein